MYGQDTSAAMSSLYGMIESQVAAFLQCRSTLNTMAGSPVLTISNQANTLLATQTSLESQLGDAVTNAQSGSITGYASAGYFLYEMEGQISAVNDLYSQYTGLGPSAATTSTMIPGVQDSTILLVAGVGVALLLIMTGKGSHHSKRRHHKRK